MSENPKRANGVKKPSPHFIPPVAIIEESVAMGLGGAKYGPFNWNDKPVDASTYYSAAMRHLMCWYSGEDMDPESGCTHLAHVRAWARWACKVTHLPRNLSCNLVMGALSQT